jgi:SPP1 family predicted phage head-tail adaptor
MKCCDMMASMLREKLTIQREVLTQDDLGGDVKTWSNIGTTYGHVRPTGGGERVFAQQLEANITHKITIRYRENIEAADRILLRGVPLQIRNILNLEMRDKWLELSCESGVAT